MKKILLGLLAGLLVSSAALGQRAIIAGEQAAGVYVNIKTDSSGNLYAIVTPTVPVGVTFTNSAVTVTNASTVAIAANAARKYLTIQNNDPADILYCTPTATATTANGVKILPAQMWNPSVAPINAINCINSDASNANIIVTEGQ